MQANQTAVMWTVIICTALMLVSLFYIGSTIPEIPVIPTEAGIANAIIAGISVPTAAEISAGIVIPVPTVPESLDNQKLQEVWDNAYSLEIEELKIDAKEECMYEFEDDNEYWYADLIEDDEFEEDTEIAELFEEDAEVWFIKGYEDDEEITITNLGLDDVDGVSGDDRAVTWEATIKVGVEPDMGDDFKDKVYITCEVTSDDGDLEAELMYSLE